MTLDDKIYEIIKSIMIEHGEDTAFKKEDNLLNTLAIDSIISLEIFAAIESEFDVKIDDEHINISMLENISKISKYVANLLGGKI